MGIELAPELRRLLEQEYPRFSDAEMKRRRMALADLMRQREVDHVVFYGAGWRGSVVQWLTRWPVTTEAAGVFTPGERDCMFVHYYNHLPLARLMADDAAVEWGGESTLGRLVDELRRRGASPGRVGLIGSLGYQGFAILDKSFGKIVEMGRDYVGLRKVKSAEELDWFRIGAWMSDLGNEALAANAKPGVSERELANAVERAYVGHGGTTSLHFIGATPMSNPSVPAPRQFHSARRLEKGDVVFSEISASFLDHSGQVLRSFAVAEQPNTLYRDLHAAADAAFDAIVSVLRAGARPADVVDAAGVIEEAGFTAVDDILHGYGGGYFPPVLGAKSRSNGKLPDEPFEAGQLVVVQPNIVTLDGRAGVQTGEMLLITNTGIERFHTAPRGFRVV
jgi:Xaa-Pro dipeptidase